MDINKISEGMKIRICKYPDLSIKQFGSLDGYKWTLGGSIQEVKEIKHHKNRVWIKPPINSSHSEISFHSLDLRSVKSPKKRKPEKPEIFDPKQLII